MSDDDIFYTALRNNDVSMMNVIPKSDLHNHMALGANREELKYYNIQLPVFKRVDNIIGMKEYVNKYLSNLMKDIEYYKLFMVCTIINAINDGVTILETSVDCRFGDFYSYDIDAVIEVLNKFKEQFKEKITIKFDIGISRRNFEKNKMEKYLTKAIESKFFDGIDLYGDELYNNVLEFKDYYIYAKSRGLKLKAHIGEFGNSENIINTIDLLNLNVVQHGISIIDSKEAMQYAKERDIQFNICPTSNYLLSRIENIKKHPIKEMIEFGLKVTINTDDMLLFNSSVSNEYIKLYKNNVLSAQDLNNIRKNSIKG